MAGAATTSSAAAPDRIAQVFIDEKVLRDVGRWPWPRSILARVTDEIMSAGAMGVAFDITFTDSSPPVDGVDQDRLLAESLMRARNVVLPMSLEFEPHADAPLEPAVREVLKSDLELQPEQVVAALARRLSSHPHLTDEVRGHYGSALEAAIVARVRDEVIRGTNAKDLRRRLLPRTDENVTESPLLIAVQREFEARRSLESAGRRLIPRGQVPGALLPASAAQAPIETLAHAASAVGFVDYLHQEDGTMRTVPLLVEFEGRVIPQFGLAVAASAVGVDLANPAACRIASDRITLLPAGGAALEIPVRTTRADKLNTLVGASFDIPLAGPDEWNRMYARWGERLPFISMRDVWDLCRSRQYLRDNNAGIDRGVRMLLTMIESDPSVQMSAERMSPDDFDARRKWIDHTMRAWKDVQGEQLEKDRDAGKSLDADSQRQLYMHDVLLEAVKRNTNLQADVGSSRSTLSTKLSGRMVLIGWSAEGGIADIVPTSVHTACPGSVVHGAIANAILNGQMYRRLPDWVSQVCTLLLGLLMTVAVMRLGPWLALMTALLLGGAFVLIDCALLFDRHRTILNMAGPLTAIATVWAGGTMARLIPEGVQRFQITRRFRSYVDPNLVDYVISHPDELWFEGRSREMTVVFADVAGFTMLTEQLRERSIPVLNELWNRAIPIIRKYRGHVNKFMGDGIMFFYNGLAEDTNHATNAVSTVLELQKATDEYCRTVLRPQGIELSLRAGISSGVMILGDAGARQFGDFTVLGDVVNLGARLESANKLFGTRTLMSARTFELAGPQSCLVRPIGNLVVTGKSQSVLAYEPIAKFEVATVGDRDFATLSTKVFERFVAGDFVGCLAALDALDSRFKPDPYTERYRRLCANYLETGTPSDFLGQIVLTVK